MVLPSNLFLLYDNTTHIKYKRYRPNGQSGSDNPEKQATLGTYELCLLLSKSLRYCEILFSFNKKKPFPSYDKYGI